MHDEVVAAAHWLGLQLADSKRREAVLKAEREQAQSTGRLEEGVCQGAIGVALTLAELAKVFPNEKSLFMESIEEMLGRFEVPDFEDSGAFSGTAGFVAAYLELHRAGLADTSDETAMQNKEQLLDEIVFAPPSCYDVGNSFEDYDLITGPAGQLLALSAMACNQADHEDLGAAARLLGDQLEAALAPSNRDERVPACWVSPENYFLESKEELPLGYINLGLAHGVPGIIASLAIASRCGLLEVSVEAMEFGVDFLLRASNSSSYSWGNQFPFLAQGGESHEASRVAWCYGTPGVAQGLAHAAYMLNDKQLLEIARSCLADSLSIGYPQNALISPTFCHGESGVVATGLSIFGPNRNAEQSALVDWHVQKILQKIDRKSILGIQEVEAIGVSSDSLGLLSGAAGVVHVLLSYLDPGFISNNTWSVITATSTLE